jgi:hypothetical protein
MFVIYIMSYCFVLLWQCYDSLEILRCQGAISSPRRVSTIISLRTRGSKATRPQAECFAHVETDVKSANQICISAIMMWFPTLDVTYQLRELRIFWKGARLSL